MKTLGEGNWERKASPQADVTHFEEEKQADLMSGSELFPNLQEGDHFERNKCFLLCGWYYNKNGHHLFAHLQGL